jgi:replication initiation and membrane attachment protein DnaB
MIIHEEYGVKPSDLNKFCREFSNYKEIYVWLHRWQKKGEQIPSTMKEMEERIQKSFDMNMVKKMMAGQKRGKGGNTKVLFGA